MTGADQGALHPDVGGAVGGPRLSEQALARSPTHIARLIADGEAQAGAFLATFDESGRTVEPVTEASRRAGREPRTAGTRRDAARGDRHRAAAVGAVRACVGAAGARGRAGGARRARWSRCSRSRRPRRRRRRADRKSEADRRLPDRRRRDAPVPGTAAGAAPTPQGSWLTPHYDKGFVLVSSAGRRRDAVPARAQPRVAVQVHEQHGDEPDVHGPQRRRARRPAAQRHPARARRLLLLRLRLRSAAGLQHPALHLDRDPGRDGGRLRGLHASARGSRCAPGTSRCPARAR